MSEVRIAISCMLRAVDVVAAAVNYIHEHLLQANQNSRKVNTCNITKLPWEHVQTLGTLTEITATANYGKFPEKTQRENT